MTRSLPIRNVFSALVLLTPLFIGRAALAQQACGDATCPKGFSCEMEAGACAAVDCVQGPCEPCVPRTALVCRPGPCSADADCAEGMACAEVEQTNCADAAATPSCLEGSSCPEVQPEGSCSTTTSKQCLPRWSLPCTADADCGVGFNCKEQQQCSCGGSTAEAPGSASSPPSGSGSSGSSGSSGATPTPAPTPTPTDCSCAPSGRNSCEAIRVACASDAGCPSGWSCRDNPEGSCWADSNGNTGCTPVDPAKLCVPPFTDLGGGSGTATDDSALPTTPSKEDPGTLAVESASANDNGGCSIGSASQRSSRDLLAWCLALGAAFGLSRRARRAA